MIEHGIVDKEMSRKQSGRNVSLRKPQLPSAATELAIMIRNRPLINAAIMHDGREVGIGIAKRMVFSVPITTLHALNAGTELKKYSLNDERSLQIIETMLHHGTGGIEPIRTAYYLATDVRESC